MALHALRFFQKKILLIPKKRTEINKKERNYSSIDFRQSRESRLLDVCCRKQKSFETGIMMEAGLPGVLRQLIKLLL